MSIFVFFMNPAKCSPAFPAGLSDLCNPKRMGVRYGRRCDVWMKSACVCPVRLRRNRTYGSARSPTTKNRARERKRARARRAGAEREAAARGNGVRERKRSAPAREGPVRNARPQRGGTGRAEEKQRARARRAGAERETTARGNSARGRKRARARRAGAEREAAARGNGTRGRKTARPRAKDRCGTQDRSAGAELTRCGRGQAQGQWSRRTATKPSRTPITVKMAGFRLWAKACDCGSTSLKVT